MSKVTRENATDVVFHSAKLIRVPLEGGKMGVGFMLENGENVHEIVLAYSDNSVTGMIRSTSPALLAAFCDPKRTII